jgi:hypothetical protein
MADSKEPPRNRLDVSGIRAVGGPVPRPWREGTLTRATELQALGTWAAHTSCPPENARATLHVLVDAVGFHLEAARQAADGMQPSSAPAADGMEPWSELLAYGAKSSPGQAADGMKPSSRPQQKKRSIWFRMFHWFYWFPTASQIQRAMSNLDAAEVLILNFAPPRYLVGQMPCLLNHVQRNLPPTDSRRKEFERIAQRIGVKDPDHPLIDKAKEPTSAEAEEFILVQRIARKLRVDDTSHRKKPTQMGEAEKIVEQERGKIVTIVRGASSAALRDQLRLRSFRNILAVTIICLTVLAIVVAIFGWFYPTRVPLCFQPSLDNGQTVIVCPTAYSRRLPLNQLPGPELNDAVAQAAKPWDHLTVELVGLIAAAVVAAIRIRKIRGSSEAPDLPVLLALLKLPMGAIIAFLGILLVRGGFIPGLSALDTPAQILSWALVFGFAQQLFTRLVDQQGQTVLDSVRGADRPNEPGPVRP